MMMMMMILLCLYSCYGNNPCIHPSLRPSTLCPSLVGLHINVCVCVCMCWCARACVCVCVCLFCSILYPFWPLSKNPFPTFYQYTNDFSSFDKHIIGYLLHSNGRDLRREVSNARSSHLDHTFTSSPISIDTILCHSFCHQLMNVI